MLIPLLALVGSPASLRAAEPDAVVPIQEGEAAPFDGDLFPVRLSIGMGLRVERCDAEKEAEIVRLIRLHENQLGNEREKHDIRAHANLERIRALTRAVEELGAWYRQPWFVATVTTAAAVGAVVLSVYVYDAIAGGLR